jgi:hypothetical protein
VKARFILHNLSHTWLVIDITAIGMSDEIYPFEGKQQMVPTFRFQSWKDVEHYLMALGADAEELARIGKTSLDVLTIVRSFDRQRDEIGYD